MSRHSWALTALYPTLIGAAAATLGLLGCLLAECALIQNASP